MKKVAYRRLKSRWIILSKTDLTYLLKALIEHKAHIERSNPYPLQKRDLQPYDALIRKLVKYRTEHFERRAKRLSK
jgi:hypothetical protein